MPYKGLESFLNKTDEQCVKDWISDLHPGSKSYVPYVLEFVQWGKRQKAREKKEKKGKKGKSKKTSDYWDSACGELLPRWKRLRNSKNESAQNKFLSTFHGYVQNKRSVNGLLTGTVDRKNCWAAICNFFEFHEAKLPELTSQQIGKMFRPSEVDVQRALALPEMTIDEVRLLIENAPMPYRAIFMTMFQAGLGEAEFQIFNEHALEIFHAATWSDVDKVLSHSGPIKVQMFRSKTSRTELRKYYTFLSDDAKFLIRQWLSMRPECKLNHLFVIRQKGPRKSGEYAPVTTPLVENRVVSLAKSLKLLSPQELEIRHYHVRPHRLRKAFIGACVGRGLPEWAAMFFIGHKISTYIQLPWTNPDKMRKEYEKAEAALNIVTGMAGVKSKQEMIRIAQLEYKKLVLSRRFSEAQIEKMDLETKSMDEVFRMAREKGSATNGGEPIEERRKQKVVRMSEVDSMLDQGWEFVEKLSNKQVIVRSPQFA